MKNKRAAKRNPWHGIEGYWLFPDGRVREVIEHYDDVRASPELYGFSHDEIAHWKREHREKALREVIARGFIRVRGHRRYTTFEFHRMDHATMSAIKEFLDRFSFWPDEEMHLHELSTGRSWSGEFRKLMHLSASRFEEVAS